MVKKFLVFLFLVFSFLSGYSQFPATQFMGNPNTLVKSKGAFGSDSGYVYIYSFSDTLAANSGYLKNIAGITIRVVDTLFQRSNNLQKWVRVGTGSGATIAEPSNQIVFGSGSGITSSPNYLYFNSGTESNVEFNNPNNGFNVLNTYVISDSVSNQFNDANGNTIYLYQGNNDTISYVYYNPIASVFLDENKIFEISGNALKNDATIYSHRSDTSGLRLFNLRSSSPTQSGGAIGVDDSGYVVRIANGGVNIYNSDGTQSDAIRTYDGDGGELSFSNLSKFKVSASDSAIIKSSNIYGTATNSFIIDSIGGMTLRKYGPDAVVTIVLDENQAILNSENNDDTSNLLVAHNGISIVSSNYVSLTADSVVLTNTPPTLTTDYDVLVRDENTGKVGIATISGADSSVFATVHKLYTTIDSLGSLIVSENLGNSNLTQSDPTRTYDGDGGELSFSNLGKFKVSASDSVYAITPKINFLVEDGIIQMGNNLTTSGIASSNIGGNYNTVLANNAINLGGNYNHLTINAANGAALGGDSLIVNDTSMVAIGEYNDTTISNTYFVVGNGAGYPSIRSNALQLLKTGALYLPYYTNTDTNKVLSANASGLLEWRTKGAGGGGGISDNPTASLGLSAVNGSATTFMRSDAAPALDQSITPTWTGLHTYRKDAIGSSITESIRLENTTAATSGNPQFSPYMSFIGRWYNTTGGTSNISNIRIFNRTFSTVNTNSPAELAFQTSFDGSTFKDAITLSAGNLNPILKILNNGELQVNNITANSSSLINFGNPIYVTSSSTNAIIGALYIGGNPSYINSSAALHINSTTKGFLPPIMTTTQRNAIGSPASGLLVHNTDSTKLSIYENGRWNQIPKVLINTATLDFGSTSAQSSADLTITVTGAADGDMVSLGVANAATLTNSSYTAWVSAADTVTVRFNNYSSGSQDPASATFKVQVFK